MRRSLRRKKQPATKQYQTMKEEHEIPPDQEIDFCTMGMFIIGKMRAFDSNYMQCGFTFSSSTVILERLLAFKGAAVRTRF
jgi:hypothetical protein